MLHGCHLACKVPSRLFIVLLSCLGIELCSGSAYADLKHCLIVRLPSLATARNIFSNSIGPEKEDGKFRREEVEGSDGSGS